MENYFIVTVNCCDEVLPIIIKAKDAEEANDVFNKACVCCDYDAPSYKLLSSNDVTLSKARVISMDLYK